jgi:tetratricopeptide (TPR) repeat protein
VALLEKLVDLNSRSVGPLLRLGTLQLERSQHGMAMDCFQRALALEPADGDALCMLGMTCNDLGRFADATRYLEQAIAAQPNTRAALQPGAGALRAGPAWRGRCQPCAQLRATSRIPVDGPGGATRARG